MYKKIHVYDLDGVLVDTSHRYRNLSNGAIDLQYWIANRTAEKIAKDKLLPHARQYVDDCMTPEIFTVLCTSREYNPLDIEFIVGRLGAPDKLLMRPEGNTESDAILKRQQLQRLFNLIQFQKLPRTLWEDNPINIDRLREIFTHVIYVPSFITGSLSQ